MSMREIFANLSWDTLMRLPPSELLSLTLLGLVLLLVLALAAATLIAVVIHRQ